MQKKRFDWSPHLLNFLAVILGVYLAFLINDRARRAEERKETQLLIQAMINDLKDDIRVYEEYHIPVNREYNTFLDSTLQRLATGRKAAAEEELALLFEIENYSPNSSIYTSMKSSGKLRLVGSVNIQRELSNFYDAMALECVEKNRVQVEFFLDELNHWLMRHADLSQMKLNSDANTTVLYNLLLIYQSLVDQKLGQYQRIVEESRVLCQALDSLLAQG